NVKLFLNKFVGIKIFHGALLSAIGHLLSKGIGRIYIPSTYSYGDLLPFGSHPLLDPMWSSKNFEIVHHGNESSRLEKIKYLNKSGVDLSKLRVCFADNDSMVNCGKCEKCIRTSLGLLAVNGIDSSEINIAALRKLNISPYNRFVYTELLYELEKIGSYPEICYAISSAIYKPMFLQSNIILLKNYLRKQKYRYPNLYRKISRTTQN
ncbi:MAG: hypothetical protein K9G34_03130, partial [Melioribacteraceae bacterium]|nr:hypothetical protein [Melioribacteraceae bacterium]